MRVSHRFCSAAFLLALVGGCSSRAPGAGSRAPLVDSFPVLGREVVSGIGFIETERGFVAKPPTDGDPIKAAEASLSRRSALQLQLPKRGEAPFDVTLQGADTVTVRERGLTGAPWQEGGALAYHRVGGTSFFAITDTGFEEWLEVDDATEAAVAEWDITGATPSLDAEAVVLSDATGRARARITAPRAINADGSPARAWLEVNGQRLVLKTSARGHALIDPSWASTSSMQLRFQHTSTLLLTGKVLVVGGRTATGVGPLQTVVELYDPSRGTWTTATPIGTPRYNHTATLLKSGRVLVAGGDSSGTASSAVVATAEIFDPTANGGLGSWGATMNPMSSARMRHTATLLANGRVLISGGTDAVGDPLASADVLTEGAMASSSIFNATAQPMTTARAGHTATLLTDGTVVVIGGAPKAEVYSPITNGWVERGALGTSRQNHSAMLLSTGKVLVAGGIGSNALKSTELYDPANGTFAAGADMPQEHAYATATLLPNNTVLLFGGTGLCCSTYPTAALAYDPVGGAWSTINIGTARAFHTATILPSGRVLMVGGATAALNATAELFDPVAGGWASTAELSSARVNFTATMLPNGQVLVAGGASSLGGPALTSAELFTPSTGVWATAAPMATARADHTATLLPSGRVLVNGGRSGAALNSIVSSAELYNPQNNTWVTTGAMGAARASHATVLLADGRVLTSGGVVTTATPPVASSELFDPSLGTWVATTGPMGSARSAHTLTLLPSGKVLVAGGQNPIGTALNTSELFSPASGTWAATSTVMVNARAWHSATLMAKGSVLAVGGLNLGAATTSVERYDPNVGANGSWSTVSPLTEARYRHTATLMANGLVMTYGGQTGASGNHATTFEAYDPSGGTTGIGLWTSGGSLPLQRHSHGATLLANGRVLVIGGQGPASAMAFVDLFSTPINVGPSKPTLMTVPALVTPNAGFSVSGGLFTGMGEGASGGTASSAANFPFLMLEGIGTDARTAVPVSSWSATGLSTTMGAPPGLYWARVIVSGSASDPRVLPVFSPLGLTPMTPTLAPKATQTFAGVGSAGSGYAWALTTNNSGGSIGATTGLYTAGSTGSVSDSVQVTDPFGNTATSSVTVSAGVSISPPTATSPPKGSIAFTATGGSNTGFVWSLPTNGSGASVPGGAYVAGATGSTSDTVEVVDSLGNLAQRVIAVTAGVSITPSALSVPTRGAQIFAASGGSNSGFTWALTTNNSGATFVPGMASYTAGSTPNVTDVITVTDSLTNTKTVTITVGPALAASPASASIAPRQSITFTATNGQPPYTWSFVAGQNQSGGTIGNVANTGTYQAGPTGLVSDRVTVVDSLMNSATVDIAVGRGVDISPLATTVPPRGAVDFSATGGSDAGFSWTMANNLSGGSIGALTGHYVAGPSGGTVDVVRATDSLGNLATANVTVSAGISILPTSATVTPKGTQTFSASGGSATGFTWSMLVNNSLTATINSSGVYTAGTKGSVTDTVQVTDSLGNAQTVSVTVSAGLSTSPPSASTPPLGTVNFFAVGGAGAPFTWSIASNNSGGASIGPTGSYKAGPNEASDIVQVSDSLGNLALVNVTVTNALAVTPNVVTLAPRASQAFGATGGSGMGYHWALTTNASGAAFDAGVALYTAGSVGGVVDHVQVTDSLGATASATINVGPGVSVTPATTSLSPRSSRTFTANGGSGTGFTWGLATNASGATIDATTGAYTAGSTGSVGDVIQATDSLGNTGIASVDVGPGLSVAPATVAVAPQGSQTFTVTGGSGLGFTWSLLAKPSGSSASIDVFTGQYQAGTRGGVTDVVQARDSLGNTGTASVTVGSGVLISPSMPSVSPKGTIEFTASGGSGAGYSWALKTNLSQGSITAAGVYAAGATGNVTDVVEATDSAGNVGTVSISVTGSLSIAPPLTNVPPKGSVAFSTVGGNAPLTWSLSTNGSGATIDADGGYRAGPTAMVTDVVHVIDGLGNSSSATVNVTAGVSISPANATLAPGGAQGFVASGGSGTGYVWEIKTNASGGSVGANGSYLAGTKGSVNDVLQVTDSLGNVGTATVSVVAGASSGPEVPFAQRPPINGWSCGCQSTDLGAPGLLVVLALMLSSRRRRASALVLATLVVSMSAFNAYAAGAKKPSKTESKAAPKPVAEPAPVAPVVEAPVPPSRQPAKNEKPSVAVLGVEVTVPDEKLDATAFSEMLVTAFDGAGVFRVTSAKDLATMLGIEREKQLLGCSDDSKCLAEFANALGTDLVLVATVGKVASNYLVTTRLVDSKRSRVAARGSAQSQDANQLLEAIWSAAQQTIDSYGASLPPPEAEAWAKRPRQTPPTAFVSSSSAGPRAWSLGASVTAVAGYQVLSTPGNRGSIGAEIDAVFRYRRLDLSLGVIIGPNVGLRLAVMWALIDSQFRLSLGLRGAAFPGVSLVGGGPTVMAEFAITPLFAVTANGGAELSPASTGLVIALLGAVGVSAHF